MIKCYAANFTRILMGLLMTLSVGMGYAQTTTLTTLPNPPYNGGNSLAGPSNVTFVIDNTNGYGVLLTGISNWLTTTENNSVWQLYYTATELSGATTDVTAAPWTFIATSQPTPATATGIAPLNFPGLSFTIPAGTQYRFALRNTGPGNTRYSGTGGSLTPNTFTGGGVNLLVGDVQISGSNVGYSGSGTGLTLTPRYFTGAIAFEPAGPCTNPPVTGTVVSTANPVCLNVPFTLSLDGGTGGTGQTYQWESSTDNVTFTPIGGATSATLTTSQSVSTYYRAVVTCGVSVTSASLFVNTPSAVQGTFTINNLAPPSPTNFQSFNAAYDYIKCGISGPVIFNVDPASGPYNEQLIMEAVPGASAANTVTFNGNGRTLTFNSTVTGQRGVVKLDGADHITFNDLVVTAPGTLTSEYGYGFHLINDADSNTINNCTIELNTSSTSTNYGGIVVSSSHTSATATGSALCDGNNFTNNTITGGYYGITIVGSTTAANQNNYVFGNNIRDFYQYGVYLVGNFQARIDSNYISRPLRSTVTTFMGVYVSSLNVRVEISRNRIFDPFGGNPTSTSALNAIHFTGVDALAGLENKVFNNLIYNLSGEGLVSAIHNIGSDNVWYMHNTIVLDGAGGSNNARAFYQTTTASGIRFVNNIIGIYRGGTGDKFGLYYNTAASEVESNRNDIYLNPAAGSAFTGFSGSPLATLADWQTATSDDLNSVSNAPLFEDAAAFNFKPTNASIDNLGAPEGVLIDILGVTRSLTTPDIGAYEFTPGNCIAPPTAGDATVSNTPVCATQTVQLGLTGHSTGIGQTYQWQSSPDNTTWTTFTGVLTNPLETVTATTTMWYRAAVTCGASTTYSTPILLTVNPALPAGTYTIGGTPGPTNYATFNDAVAAMNCGIAGHIIFDVVPNSGPYNEQVIIGEILGSAADKTVTFKGNGNTLAFSSDVTGERAVIKLRGTDFFTFDSLIIDATGAGTYGFGVHLLSNADSNKFVRNTVLNNITSTSTNFAGIVISASETSATGTGSSECDGNVIDSNTVIGGYYGITCVGSTTVANQNNIITNNKVQDYYIYGIYLSGNYNTLVEHNEMSRPVRANSSTHYGVYVTSLNVSLDISKNRIFNPFGGNPTSTSNFNGIYFTGVDALAGLENIVSNNAIYEINGLGDQYGLYNTSSDNVWYFHNTVSLTDQTNNTANFAYGFYQTTTAGGIDVRNNIFQVTRSGSSNNVGIFLNTSTSTVTSDYNNFHITGANPYIGNSGGLIPTLVQWRATTGQDLNSLATNPFFASPSTGNLMPMSPVLDNKGTPGTGITTDILDAARSATTPDIGAWEFAVPPCTAPPTAGAASAVPNTGICMGASVFLSLGSNSTGAGQTYQWEFSTSPTGPWSPLGDPMMFPDTTILASTTLYYRVAVTCSGNTQFSDAALVTINPAFLGGDYTIDPTNPPFYPAPGSTNFESFTTAVAALECGITSSVNFYVAPGTYTEQVRMHSIAGTGPQGAGPDVRVTFMAANGNPASVNLTYDALDPAANYVLQLDSASYVTYKNMTITPINTTNGRAVQLAGTASFDSILNVTIPVPASTSTSNATAGIFADDLLGSDNVIKQNIITGGNVGIYINGLSVSVPTMRNIIDSNSISGQYQYGIYIGLNGKARVEDNSVHVTAPRNSTSYGIYSTSTDSAFVYQNNMVTMENNTTTIYGMYFTGSEATAADRGRIEGNEIVAINGNTGTTYGIYHTGVDFATTINNVVNVKTDGTSSYGIYHTGGLASEVHNNTVVNASTATGNNNVAAYLTQTSGAQASLNIRNNIFYHTGGGRAMYTTNTNFIYSDYNTFFTTGPVLIQWNAGNQYATLQEWRDTSYWDLSSIAIQPALISATDLRPDLANPDVWAIHGRGVQIEGNDHDKLGNARSTTLTDGVPDMGAYEFFPTVEPTVLTGTPAVPVAGQQQYFMYGTDTVTVINWAAGAPVPSSISLKRYSGVIPPGLATGQESMYYYFDVEVPAQGAYNYSMKNYYVDSWQGFIPSEPTIKLGRTDAANNWVVNLNSTVDQFLNYYSDNNLQHIDKFTGLTDGTVPPIAPSPIPVDSSNAGTRFWVAYGHHYDFSSNAMDMVLYLSATQAANVTVRVNGTPWVKNYSIAANTAIVSDIMPKSGLVDARITDEGLFDRGISITSDVPIVAYAHIYNGSNSGAGMLLPVGVYGYEYQSLNSRQYYPSGGAGSYSWFFVVADHDSTLVEITPVVETKLGRPAGVPFQVYLNKGQVYNVMGTQTGGQGTDMSGSTIRSIANANGDCFPIGVFSGSSRTAICNTTNGDNMIQQVFPSQAWGTKYATFATATSTSTTQYNSNMFRVMVKDPATQVSLNGTLLTGLIVPGNYYEFFTPLGTGPGAAVYVEADKPVMMAQYMVSTGGTQCPGVSTSGNGDPEMIYISPIEQGIKKAVFYNTDEDGITSNYINVVISNGGLATLTIDGNNTFTDVFPHPNLPGYTCIRHNLGGAASQHIIESDSAFTAITYGLGSVESYGYNAGTLVKNLNGIPFITNTLGNSSSSAYTCTGAPFRFSVYIPLKPTSITWEFSAIANLSPNTDSVQTNPNPIDSIFSNGRWLYRYEVMHDFTFTLGGTYQIPIHIEHPSIEGCDNVQTTTLVVIVYDAPIVDFTTNFSGCLGEALTFNGSATTPTNVPISTWEWDFGGGNTPSGQNQVFTFPAAGTYDVSLSIISQDGCVGDTVKQVVVNEVPDVAVIEDTLYACGADGVTFEVDSPDPGVTYNWYTAETGGTIAGTGTTFTLATVSGIVRYWVEAETASGCKSERTMVYAEEVANISAPVAVVDSAGVDMLRFRWDAVPDAIAYEVTTDGGATWITPSSGSTGLTHTITGLLPLESVTLQVRALGIASCQVATSNAVTGTTVPTDIFIPNAFTPNGDGLNDVLMVYGYTIESMRMIVFNQWGQKIFESTNQATGWNGMYKGKIQPSGVYMYVIELSLRDGTKEVRKGSINLVR